MKPLSFEELKALAESLYDITSEWSDKIFGIKEQNSEAFREWAKTQSNLGMSYETINNHRKSLKRLPVFLQKIHENQKVKTLIYASEFDTAKEVRHLKKFNDLAQEFINQRTLTSKAPIEVLHQWYFYFLELGPKKYGFPKLARGLLKLYTNNKAVLQFPSQKPEIGDYEGTFSKLNANVAFFDMVISDTDESRNIKAIRNIHIKINYCKLSDEIVLGTYSTYDELLYTGSLVLEAIPDSKQYKENIEDCVTFLSTSDNREQFLDVDESIRLYLGTKGRNIKKLPKKIIENKKGLSNFIKINRKESQNEDDIENRFLELDKPIVFVASPQTSIGDTGQNMEHMDFIDDMVHRLKTTFDELDFYTEKTASNNPKDTNPLPTIKILEKTRFFVLILPKTSKTSFSLIQFALALKTAKHILFIHDDCLSQRIKKLKYINNNLIFLNRPFKSKKQKEYVYSYIYDFIVSNLFDGS
ncbi:hypothetical protein V1387_04860 [Allomuricauda taeanensis]|uniref:hypothetical protein n=1 Tax=Flagellimonas taeanensis TaxID=1005926 RepID=UPI002E7BCE72|nr:hypothetical protein [Allomuricauda taeanensis]MEE1962006.1 hypothetical protein [Allomuricauda taeanensis]